MDGKPPMGGAPRTDPASSASIRQAPGGGDPEPVAAAPEPDSAALADRLRELDVRLGARRAAEEAVRAARRRQDDATGMAKGLRLSADFIAGVIVGAGIGWILDRWLGTTPWGLIVFLLLGFAAGVLNVMRSVGLAPQPGSGDWKPKDPPPPAAG